MQDIKISIIFAPTNSTTPLHNAYQGGTFILYTLMNYAKQPLDYPQILQLLKDRGLIVRDETEALRQLKIISYFRLANYMRPMEADKTTHLFKQGSSPVGSAHKGFYAYNQLLHAEWLAQIVVGSRLKAPHHVLRLSAVGRKQFIMSRIVF